MKKFNKNSILSLATLVFVFVFSFVGSNNAYAATSPTLVGSAAYSVLGATTVTNTGATTTVGEVGVSAGTAITGFADPGGPGFAAGNNALHVHSNDASAISAQADNLTAFGALDAGANASANCLSALTGLPGTDVSGQDLVGLSLAPGLYCSAGSYLLTNAVGTDLTLTGAGPWVFKTVSTVIVSSGASVAVPAPADACNVWWRVGSSSTVGTGASFLGNILALDNISLATGASLVGRALVQTGQVTLDTNAITGCAVPLAPANLTLNKIVSGSSPESTWTLTATGPAVLSGPGAPGAIDVVGNVPAGTYALSESGGPSNYTSSLWSCAINAGPTVLGNSVVLDWGDTAICAITNTYFSSGGGGGGPRIPPPAPFVPTTLRIIKEVVNNSGGIASASSFNLHVKSSGADILGSPAVGVVAPGIFYAVAPGTYVVSEDANTFYTSSFSGDCDSNGSVTLSTGENKVCTITNDDIAPGLPKTGLPPEPWNIVILGLAVFLVIVSASLISVLNKHKV